MDRSVFFCLKCKGTYVGNVGMRNPCPQCSLELTDTHYNPEHWKAMTPEEKTSIKDTIILDARAEASRREEEAQQQAFEDREKKRAMAQMLITSGFNFDGYRIVKYSGYISGDDAMTVSRGSSFTDGGVRDKLMDSLVRIRRNALRELKEAAYDLGCNAVIGVDFDYITLDPQTANITGGTTYQPYVFCVTANGNAVIIEKTED